MSSKTVNKSTYTQRCETLMRKFGDKVPNVDIWNIGLRCGDDVEDLEPISNAESMLLLRNGKVRRRGYSRSLFALSGDINIKTAFTDYTRLVRSAPELRTTYITEGVSRPLRVVSSPTACLFPIFDITQLSDEQRKETIFTAVEAEGRREYDPRTNSPLRLRCFLIGEEKACVVVSVCDGMGFAMKAQDIVGRVFAGIASEEFRSEAELAEENTADRESSIEHWKNEFKEPPAEQTLPGYIAGATAEPENCSLLFPLDKQLCDRIGDFCDGKKISRRAMFLMAWSEFQGRYNSAEEVTLLLRSGGKSIDLCPVKVRRSLKTKECAESIDGQIQAFTVNSGCDFEEMCSAVGADDRHRFLTVHSFSDCLSGNTSFEDSGAALSIAYRIDGDKPRITYTFNANGFAKKAAEKIHKVVMSILEEFMSPEQQRTDVRKSLKFSEMNEEQLRRSRIFEKAMYLSQTGLFEGISIEELMRLGERAALQSCALDDVIIEERRALCELAFVVNGKVEESMIGAGGVVKSVSVRKKGDIIGIRALLENNISQFTYTAASSDTEVLYIKREDFYSFAGTYPKVWAAILENTADNADRMARLWTIM